jgi:hypothetical protein
VLVSSFNPNWFAFSKPICFNLLMWLFVHDNIFIVHVSLSKKMIISFSLLQIVATHHSSAMLMH